MGPYNFRPELIAEKIRRIDRYRRPGLAQQLPARLGDGVEHAAATLQAEHSMAAASMTAFIMNWPNKIAAKGELRHQFVHASDLTPTLLDLIGVTPPAEIAGVAQMPMEGESFARSVSDASAPSKSSAQYFEMFGHRGLWQDGWKAVSFHPSGTPFENDKWELFHLDKDFSETNDLATAEPERLEAMIKLWWSEAEKHKVLPLDDRFAARFAENAARFQGARNKFTFHAGMGHVPTDVAPDVRSRSYTIEAHVEIGEAGAEGVLISHGDMTTGYSLYMKDGLLLHDLNIGGGHEIVTSNRKVPAGAHRLGVHVERPGCARKRRPAGARAGVTSLKYAIDRWRTRGLDRDPARLQQFHLVVRPRHRPRPLQPGLALHRAVRIHRPAVEGDGRHARRPEARRRRRGSSGNGAAVGLSTGVIPGRGEASTSNAQLRIEGISNFRV